MRVLVYKRTHIGDPDSKGVFGINGCMGRIRNLPFDAVIGIGSLRPWRDSSPIAGKINWIGVEPHSLGGDRRGRRVRFERFALFEERGPQLETFAPTLAHRFYVRNARFLFDSFNKQEQEEIASILAWFLSSSAMENSTLVKEVGSATGCSPSKAVNPGSDQHQGLCGNC